MNRFGIYGAGGCGRGVLPVARQRLQADVAAGVADLVFVDDNLSTPIINGQRVLTYAQWLELPARSRHINVAISDSHVRQKLAEQCAADGVRFFEVRAANVVQMDEVDLGEGAVLCPFVTLTSNIRIGKHFHANVHTVVEHDCVLGDFVTFGPGVRCNGNVHMEDHVYVGAGALIKQGSPDVPLVIGRNAVIGMGAVVTKSVLPGAVLVGNPARPLLEGQ